MPTLPIILVLIAAAPPISPTSPPRDAPEIHPDYEHVVISKDSEFEACGVADFDRDGDLDIVCGDAWYEAPDWTRHPIGLVRSVGGYRVDFADVPMDVDGDGWIDVVSCSWHDRGVFWRQNPGTDGRRLEDAGSSTVRATWRPRSARTSTATDSWTSSPTP